MCRKMIFQKSKKSYRHLWNNNDLNIFLFVFLSKNKIYHVRRIYSIMMDFIFDSLLVEWFIDFWQKTISYKRMMIYIRRLRGQNDSRSKYYKQSLSHRMIRWLIKNMIINSTFQSRCMWKVNSILNQIQNIRVQSLLFKIILISTVYRVHFL